MGTSVQVTPLSGVYNENPLSYLVSIDGFNFLIDCGWNDHFDPSLLQPLSKVASKIDAVLISYGDMLHLGALPFAMKQFGLNAPVFSTKPVYRLGLLTMYDQSFSRKVSFTRFAVLFSSWKLYLSLISHFNFFAGGFGVRFV